MVNGFGKESNSYPFRVGLVGLGWKSLEGPYWVDFLVIFPY